MLSLGKPALILAPMEGVTDAPMRAFQGESGAFTYGVSEFLRVSQEVPPSHVFLRHIPELNHGCVTPSGMPVQIQLLGGDPDRLAAAAKLAVELGAPGIDLNFGCPAPTVNRHDGGATLLKCPDRLRNIIATVRRELPAHIPVSAKLRLGWDDMNAIHENADMAAEGGAAWITIHGRTKTQGYIPPAYWGPIGEVKRRLNIPVVANGEIWSLEDFLRCREETQCDHFMIGRGALADPTLAPRIARALGITSVREEARDRLTSPDSWIPLLKRFVAWSEPHPRTSPAYTVRRIKQWLNFASRKGYIAWFDEVKRCESLEEIFASLTNPA